MVSLSSRHWSRAWWGGWGVGQSCAAATAGLGGQIGRDCPAAQVPWEMQAQAPEQGWDGGLRSVGQYRAGGNQCASWMPLVGMSQ